MTNPLKGNPQRSANDSIRGYLYQMWHSVHAWLDLDDDELLFLEGAEDLDVVSESEATTVQVKNTSTNATLRSQGVVDAINHFWSLRLKNPNTRISFRYVTTAGIGIEKTAPFGTGIPGIELWRKCAKRVEDPHRLREFLTMEGRLSAEVLEFLKSATDDQLVDLLLKPIAWDTRSPDVAAVRSAVENKLVAYGSRQGVPPYSAIRAADRLLREAFTVASNRQSRALTRHNFYGFFEETTSERVPREVLNALLLQATSKSVVLGGACADERIGVDSAFIHEKVPREVPGLLARDGLVLELRQTLLKCGVLSLHGSAGMGKTTLAKQLAKSNEARCLWTSLKGQAEQSLRQVLLLTAARLDSERDVDTVVLDDLDLHPATTAIIEDVLSGLLYTALERRTPVIITTHREIPQRVKRSLALDGDPEFRTPTLSVDEIAAFAIQHTCPEKDAKVWAAIVEAQTGGHPQLVHARIIALENENWPAPSERDIASQSDVVVAERGEARQQLLYALPEPEREMVYRLSLLPVPFRRDHAIAIAEIDPPLQGPGLVFDKVVGPWIEQVGSGYYQISSLLQDAADRDWSPDTWMKFRILAAHKILACGELTLIEARQAILLSMMTDTPSIFVPVVMSLLDAPFDTWPTMAAELSWLLMFATKKSTSLFDEMPAARLLLRAFQFKIAAFADPIAGTEIVDLWEEEIVTIGDQRFAELARFNFANTVCAWYQVPISGKRFVSLLHDVYEIGYRNPDARDMLDKASLDPGDVLPPGMKGATAVKLLVSISIQRCQERDFLSTMFEALAEAPQQFREHILSLFVEQPALASIMINASWLQESERPSSDWSACLEAYSKVEACAESWQCPPLLSAAAWAKAIVLCDYIKDYAGALSVLDLAADKLESTSYVIEDARARVRFCSGEFQDSLSIWSKILPAWPTPDPYLGADIGLFSGNLAGVSAARVGDWDSAAEMFLLGRQRAKMAGKIEIEAGYLADAGFAFWRNGEPGKAIDAFLESTTLLEAIPSVEGDLSAYTVSKYVGATITWRAFAQAHYPTEQMTEPTAGWCSSPERDERIFDLPLASSDFCWLHIATLECYASTEMRTHARLKARLMKSPLPLVRQSFARITLEHDLRQLDFKDFPIHLQTFIDEVRASQVNAALAEGEVSRDPTIIADSGSVANYDSEIGTLIIVALLKAVAHGNSVSDILASWRASVAALDESVVRDLTILADEIFALSYQESETLLSDAAASHPERLLAATRICELDESSPKMMMYAHVFLVKRLSQSYWAEASSEAISTIVTRQWLRLSKSPAILANPRLTVPEIQTACGASPESHAKAASILLAAMHAVRLELPQDVVQPLRHLAESSTTSD